MLSKEYKAAFQLSKTSITPISTKGKKAVMLISVGQTYHEAEKLLATVKLINKSSFSQCDIVVADSLQRYNYYHVMPEDKSYSYAQSIGDSWIARNKEILDKLEAPFEIIRWDSQVNHPNYKYFKKIICSAYETDQIFKQSVESTIDRFIERQSAKSQSQTWKLKENSIRYIMEELPVLVPLWHSLGYDYVVYPQKMTSATSYIYNTFIKNNEDKFSWLPLKFKKRTRKTVEM